MSWTYDEVMATLGDEAQAVPGGILVYRNEHIMVGLTGGGGFVITPEGAKILSAYEAPTAAPAPRARRPKARPVSEAELDAKLDELGLAPE